MEPTSGYASSSYQRHAARRQMATWSEGSSSQAVSQHSHEESARDRRPITRVNRACNACRRAKIRCVGADNPPCERCRVTDQACVLEKPPKSAGTDTSGVEDRLHSLESQMTSMRSLLQEVVYAVRGEGSRGTPAQASQATPVQTAQTGSTPRHVGSSQVGSTPGDTRSLFSPITQAPAMAHAESPHHDIHNHGQLPSASSAPDGSLWLPAPTDRRAQDDAFPPTRDGSGSESADDVLAMEEMANPLGGFSSMATRMEAAQERRRESKSTAAGVAGGVTALQRSSDDKASGKTLGQGQDERPPKRARLSPVPSPVGGDEDKDPIARGIISAEEGAALVDIFFSGSNDFVNCYDPSRDTFLSLQQRSPFSLTAVLMVGARVRDGGGPASATQRACVEYTQRMAMRTLVRPVSSVEDVKAMVLLAAYSDNGWLIAGHAVRMAIDMGINCAFNKLLRNGMGAGKTPAELEQDRRLVEQARVWYCVYRLEHQMSYGLGRPAIVREDATIHNCRLFLDHPLVLDSDTRLVYAVELLAIRAPLHIDLTATPDLPLDHETLARLRLANEQLDTWERHWAEVLERRYRTDQMGFIRDSLAMQRQLAELFINSQLLRGIHSAADVAAMSDEKRSLALRALRNAQRAVEICLRGQFYSAGLPYATHYTHVCAAFAASFLIRIARFFPAELDLARAADDVEQVANVLSKIPAGRYARSLRLILHQARREKIIPAPTPQAQGPPPLTGTDPALAGTDAAQLAQPRDWEWLDAFDFDTGLLSGPQGALDRMGLGKDAPLPLFLNGDLGTSIGPSDAVPFVGLEDFFVPVELDDLLASLGGDGHQVNN